MSQLLALSLYSQFSRCASTSKTFVLRTMVVAMTNKRKSRDGGNRTRQKDK